MNSLPVEQRYINERKHLGNKLTDEKGRYLDNANRLAQKKRNTIYKALNRESGKCGIHAHNQTRLLYVLGNPHKFHVFFFFFFSFWSCLCSVLLLRPWWFPVHHHYLLPLNISAFFLSERQTKQKAYAHTHNKNFQKIELMYREVIRNNIFYPEGEIRSSEDRSFSASAMSSVAWKSDDWTLEEDVVIGNHQRRSELSELLSGFGHWLREFRKLKKQKPIDVNRGELTNVQKQKCYKTFLIKT